jgi:O-antigen/teichoic acid export membrane protein
MNLQSILSKNEYLKNLSIKLGVLPHNGVETLRHRTFKGTSWAFLGATLSQGLGFLCMLVVARLLKPEFFGEFSIIRTTTAMFGIFAGFGLGYTASKHIAQYRNLDPQRAGRVWGLVDMAATCTSLIVGALVFFFSSYISENILKAPHLNLMLKISSITVFFNTMIWIQNFILGGFEAFKRIATIEISRGVLYFPVMIAGSYFWGSFGAVVGLSIVSVGGFIVSKAMLKRESIKQKIYIDRHGGFQEFGIILRFTLPALTSSIVVISGQWIANAILVRQNGGMQQNGLFSAANLIPEIIAFLPMTLGNPVVSIMSNTFGQGKYNQFRKLVLANVGFVGAATLVVSVIVALLAPVFIAAYGTEYSSAVRLLQIGCATVLFRSISRMTSQVLMAMGRVKIELVFSTLQTTALLLVWNMLLVHKAMGLSIATLTSFFILFLIQGCYVYKSVWNLKEQPIG